MATVSIGYGPGYIEDFEIKEITEDRGRIGDDLLRLDARKIAV